MSGALGNPQPHVIAIQVQEDPERYMSFTVFAGSVVVDRGPNDGSCLAWETPFVAGVGNKTLPLPPSCAPSHHAVALPNSQPTVPPTHPASVCMYRGISITCLNKSRRSRMCNHFFWVTSAPKLGLSHDSTADPAAMCKL